MADVTGRSWEEAALTTIIIRAAEAAAEGVGPHSLCRFLIDAMDWFAANRPAPETPDPYSFEAWLIKRTLRWVQSAAFEESVEYEQLRAEWEREG